MFFRLELFSRHITVATLYADNAQKVNIHKVEPLGGDRGAATGGRDVILLIQVSVVGTIL